MTIYVSPPFGTWIDLEKTISIRGSFTPEPRRGLIKHTLKSLRYTSRGWVNKIGLRNPGIRNVDFNRTSVISLVSVQDNWEEFLDIVPSWQKIELNLSCPNVHRYSIDSITLRDITTKYDWVMCKLSPNGDVFDQCKFLLNHNVRRIHMSNAVAVDEGGLSGREVKKFNMRYIPRIQKQFPNLEIIGGGGIYSPQDLLDYSHLGIQSFSLSTVFFNPWKVDRILKTAEMVKNRK